jgi:hypothetical protein
VEATQPWLVALPLLALFFFLKTIAHRTEILFLDLYTTPLGRSNRADDES